MCLSVKLHLRRLLFMQYKITWLVTVEYIYVGLWEYVLIVTRVALEFFTILNMPFTFWIFEELVLSLKTEFPRNSSLY